MILFSLRKFSSRNLTLIMSARHEELSSISQSSSPKSSDITSIPHQSNVSPFMNNDDIIQLENQILNDQNIDLASIENSYRNYLIESKSIVNETKNKLVKLMIESREKMNNDNKNMLLDSINDIIYSPYFYFSIAIGLYIFFSRDKKSDNTNIIINIPSNNSNIQPSNEYIEKIFDFTKNDDNLQKMEFKEPSKNEELPLLLCVGFSSIILILLKHLK